MLNRISSIMKIFNVLIIICIVKNSYLDSECNSIFGNLKKYTSDINNELLSFIHSNKVLLEKNDYCIEYFILRGKLSLADNFVKELKKINISSEAYIKKGLLKAIEKAKNFYDNFKFLDTEYNVVYPCFEWAQSMDRIFINIKFSHKWDAPGCMDVKDSEVLVHENLVMINTVCVIGDNPVKYVLNLDLYDYIDENDIMSNTSTTGRFQLSLKKKTSGYWKILRRKYSDFPKNSRIWIEMRDKFIDQLPKFEDEEEENEDEIQEILKLRKKRSESNK